MAGSKITIYIGREALEEVAVCSDKYPNLYNIFKKNASICIDLADEDFDKIFEDSESDLSQFCLRNDIEAVPLHSYFETINSDKSIMVEKPHAMFFFHISEDEAKSLSKRYGVIVQSDNAMDDRVLKLSFNKKLCKGETVSGNNDGWSNLFANIKMPPSNSLVISDNYLLQNVKNKKMAGLENLKILFDSILPLSLDTVFHILVITRMPQNINSGKADELNEELKTYLRGIRNYEIQLEFVFTNTLHPRKLISNYYELICDKGFQVFYPIDNTKVLDDNEIRLSSILHDPIDSSGDTVLQIIAKDLSDIKKMCKVLQEQIIGGVRDNTKKITGDCGSDKSIRNRLLI